jgi:hypothetical protein
VLDDIRRAHLLRFPYAMYYFIDGERIVVIACTWPATSQAVVISPLRPNKRMQLTDAQLQGTLDSVRWASRRS